MSSPTSRIAALEAQARKNQTRIDELTHTNWLLNNYNDNVIKELLNFEAVFDIQHTSPGDILPEPPPNLARPPVHTNSLPTQVFHYPEPPQPTPFYIAARASPHISLSLVIPVFKGEALELAVNSVDLVFILRQALRRKGWGDTNIQQGVSDFLSHPMIKVTWQGKEGEYGNLL
ncbi:hypothetical protein A1F94_007699 [Pyrenophora tritici-repentis]|uniref:Uncharacterized protein n=2 Tax=Pyrenophora tritici-repentis TaxID=45151 RepID=A0A2W1I8D7_9PLEO|nr:uncharacterized protein PTRG_07636 [Pyrenophora tritici-repentis Pt-1C-BFP]KAF7446347.1 hypothetical protein A1F99_096380 [Pyrenophora tritici-repentis]EDU50555.1 predicted protein [Pyrenophora tritici-repentis Pt-1C-BFP]KAF7567456.1 hypothetical protein PtrM4_140470 [Pyrenophora tritici-repentis]KAG9382045.1 hypothetical protein A1F94_007699 [Pyrenophora tritici-repentis]KAI1515333.1 hypothetical protein Ptr86124_005334 [Pyrenophora tritici-repentis]